MSRTTRRIATVLAVAYAVLLHGVILHLVSRAQMDAASSKPNEAPNNGIVRQDGGRGTLEPTSRMAHGVDERGAEVAEALVFVMVMTGAGARDRRNAMRETWLSTPDPYVPALSVCPCVYTVHHPCPQCTALAWTQWTTISRVHHPCLYPVH